MPIDLPPSTTDSPAPNAVLGKSLLKLQDWQRIGQSLHLSRRELQIVQSVFDDSKEALIAQQLGISPHTINTYIQRIYQKLNVNSRPQLIVRVFAEYFAINGGRREG